MLVKGDTDGQRGVFRCKLVDRAVEDIEVQAIIDLSQPSIARYCIQLGNNACKNRSGLKLAKENPVSQQSRDRWVLYEAAKYRVCIVFNSVQSSSISTVVPLFWEI